MASEIIAVGTTVGTQSAELTHVAGTPITYIFKGIGRCRLLFKDNGANLIDTGIEIGSATRAAVVIDAAGVFRWERTEGNCGVQQG